ncbi:MAG: decaprenyl-phosphate phosphoribosyltransferase [Oscillospiraceae bacterium]|nr:decaprenyl-phosphate phosphoribosyltransferase [Oscillospiraceae bacterium]
MLKYLKLFRLKHYIKNLLVFLPLIFGGQLLGSKAINSLWGFIAFGLISSAVYIINDIRDAEKDRQHPTKRNRPIASGAISAKRAAALVPVLVILALGLNYLATGFEWLTYAIPLAYLALNIAYSFGLKNIPIIDITILASGFLLRLIYGAALTDIAISKWLYLTVIAASFYLALGKRRNELIKHSGDATRNVLAYYNKGFLDKNMYLCMALAVTFYSLWSIDSVTTQRVGNQNLIWTVPIVLLICMKYSMVIEGSSDGDPVEVLLGDKLLLGLIAVLAAVIGAVIYL